MIVWVRKEALGTPNIQRCKVLLVQSERTVVVEMCGSREVKAVAPEDITTIELQGQHGTAHFTVGLSGICKFSEV